jgi:2-(1,2-epoxy-1,2-dihydrophenyl)acetyl-CoA isomerase
VTSGEREMRDGSAGVSAMTDHIIVSQSGGIATVMFNRPEARNALNEGMLWALPDIGRRLAADASVRLVIVTGSRGAFCAGGDVKAMAAEGLLDPGRSFEQRVDAFREFMEFSRLLHEMPKPTLAVISGPAAGAGLSIALACDVRIAAEDAKLTTAFSKVGLSGDFGGTYFLQRLVGAAKARELYFMADVLDGKEAYALGIVNRAVPSEHLAEEAEQLAARLARLPTVAIAYMKKNLNRGEYGSLSQVLDSESVHLIRTMMTDDHQAASRAFAEKRPPEFQGR